MPDIALQIKTSSSGCGGTSRSLKVEFMYLTPDEPTFREFDVRANLNAGDFETFGFSVPESTLLLYSIFLRLSAGSDNWQLQFLNYVDRSVGIWRWEPNVCIDDRWILFVEDAVGGRSVSLTAAAKKLFDEKAGHAKKSPEAQFIELRPEEIAKFPAIEPTKA